MLLRRHYGISPTNLQILKSFSFLTYSSFFLPAVKWFDKLAGNQRRFFAMNSSANQLFRQQTIGKKKRERTRGALLDSAISVFANKGYEGTRISDITAHADVANGTFYNYYQDKDQLLHDVALGGHLGGDAPPGTGGDGDAVWRAVTPAARVQARVRQTARVTRPREIRRARWM